MIDVLRQHFYCRVVLFDFPSESFDYFSYEIVFYLIH